MAERPNRPRLPALRWSPTTARRARTASSSSCLSPGESLLFADLNLGTRQLILVSRPPCYFPPSCSVFATPSWAKQPRRSKLDEATRASARSARPVGRPRFAYSRFCSNTAPAGFAEVGFLPSQAGGDRPDVGNLARAEAVDVGRAGPLLFGGCEFGVRQAGCEPAEKQAERQCAMSAFRTSHDGASCGEGAGRGTAISSANTGNIFRRM